METPKLEEIAFSTTHYCESNLSQKRNLRQYLNQHQLVISNKLEQYQHLFYQDLLSAIRLSPLTFKRPNHLLLSYFSEQKGKTLFDQAGRIIETLNMAAEYVLGHVPNSQKRSLRFMLNKISDWYPSENSTLVDLEHHFIQDEILFVRGLVKSYLRSPDGNHYLELFNEDEVNHLIEFLL